MASIHRSIGAFLLILNVLLVSAGLALSGREIPIKSSKILDKKQPESFIDIHDGSVLVPGLGRYIFPKPWSHFNPFTYNPVTGTNGGNGLTVPGMGSTGSSTGHSYVPGGDDTFVPNPGVEVPVGGGNPAPASP